LGSQEKNDFFFQKSTLFDINRFMGLNKRNRNLKKQGLRECGKCHEIKNLTNFYKKHGWCINCHRKYHRENRGRYQPQKTGIKKCYRCHKTYSIDSFIINSLNKDGLDSWCKKCHKDYKVQKKKCIKCNKKKYISSFYRINGKYDSVCKECRDKTGKRICSGCKKLKNITRPDMRRKKC
jgi:hypothetical protein